MNDVQNRKEASNVLAITMQTHYRAMLAAVGEEEITHAAVNLGQTFNDNIEFIIYVLKTYGGLYANPPKPRSRVLPKLPADLVGTPH